MSETMTVEDNKIACRLCGERTHIMQVHLRDHHAGMTEAEYLEAHPGAPMLSAAAIAGIEKRRAAAAAGAAPAAPAMTTIGLLGTEIAVGSGNLHEVFKLGSARAAMSKATGAPVPIPVFQAPSHLACYVPETNSNYVYSIDLLKTVLMGLQANIPTYLWGMSGVGKTTIFEQIMASTGRPWLRVQHTRNTEESHVVGQWVVRENQTVFDLGPLAFAMKYGLTYCADEYDFGMPSVLALYQPVLEGKALLIKEADEANRLIKPHPLFRFIATGNTNGTGDETGLYQGTLVQNAANYERFGIVEEVHYPEKKVEVSLVAAQAGITRDVAEKLVEIGNMCREAFRANKLGLPPSPRALINAGKNGHMRGDFAAGLKLAYTNRLSTVDREAVNEIVARVKL